MLATAGDVAGAGGRAVVLCGHNEALRRRVERARVGVGLGWSREVATLLAVGDVVVQNAGGLACMEALAAGRPVVSYRVLPGHGADNAAVLEAAGLVPWLRTPGELTRTVRGIGAGLEDARDKVCGGRDRSPSAASRGVLTGRDPADVIVDTVAAHVASERVTRV